jgi:hypothetical protein
MRTILGVLAVAGLTFLGAGTASAQGVDVRIGPNGVRLEQDGSDLVLRVTKIMDWFKDDFEQWGGGSVPFLKKHLSQDKVKKIGAAKKVEIEFDDYSWKLNDTSR